MTKRLSLKNISTPTNFHCVKAFPVVGGRLEKTRTRVSEMDTVGALLTREQARKLGLALIIASEGEQREWDNIELKISRLKPRRNTISVTSKG